MCHSVYQNCVFCGAPVQLCFYVYVLICVISADDLVNNFT